MQLKSGFVGLVIIVISGCATTPGMPLQGLSTANYAYRPPVQYQGYGPTYYGASRGTEYRASLPPRYQVNHYDKHNHHYHTPTVTEYPRYGGHTNSGYGDGPGNLYPENAFASTRDSFMNLRSKSDSAKFVARPGMVWFLSIRPFPAEAWGYL